MIVQGRLILDPDEPPAPGWVEVEGHRIARVGGGVPPARPDAGNADALVAPGFIDAHVHLPQFDVVGYDGLDLLDWLDDVVFPAESRWSDPTVMARQIERAYRRMLHAGTLGYAGFLTSHPDGPGAVHSVHERLPLRAVVGRTLMDRNAPESLTSFGFTPPPPASPDGRLEFSLNPRFAINCSQTLLAAVGATARSGARVHTHLAEQTRECRIVQKLFPDDTHYTGVYDRLGLLRAGTLLAHCVHLGADEWRLIAERRAVVVHCPGANTFLQSGIFDLGAARAHGVRLALGSDIAAGPDVAMPRVARAMIEVAKMRAMSGATDAPVPTPAEAWRLITEGNADALGFAGAGRLAVGAPADLLVLEPPFVPDEHLIGRLLYTWRDEYVTTRIVAGRIEPGGC